MSAKTKPTPQCPLVLVLAPTRELASQISEVVAHAVAAAPGDVAPLVSATCVYGGVDKKPQRHALRSATFVVATPGRLLDLANEGAVDLSRVEVRFVVVVLNVI